MTAYYLMPHASLSTRFYLLPVESATTMMLYFPLSACFIHSKALFNSQTASPKENQRPRLDLSLNLFLFSCNTLRYKRKPVRDNRAYLLACRLLFLLLLSLSFLLLRFLHLSIESSPRILYFYTIHSSHFFISFTKSSILNITSSLFSFFICVTRRGIFFSTFAFFATSLNNRWCRKEARSFISINNCGKAVWMQSAVVPCWLLLPDKGVRFPKNFSHTRCSNFFHVRLFVVIFSHYEIENCLSNVTGERIGRNIGLNNTNEEFVVVSF